MQQPSLFDLPTAPDTAPDTAPAKSPAKSPTTSPATPQPSPSRPPPQLVCQVTARPTTPEPTGNTRDIVISEPPSPDTEKPVDPRIRLDNLKPRAAHIFHHKGQTYAYTDLGQHPDQYAECLTHALHNLRVLQDYRKSTKTGSIQKDYDKIIHTGPDFDIRSFTHFQNRRPHDFVLTPQGWHPATLTVIFGSECPECGATGTLNTTHRKDISVDIGPDGTLTAHTPSVSEHELNPLAHCTCNACGHKTRRMPYTIRVTPYHNDLTDRILKESRLPPSEGKEVQ